MRAVVLVSLLSLGCATAEEPSVVPQFDAATDTGSATDTGTLADDDTGATDSAADTTAPAETGACKIVINEVQTGDMASGSNDFVELYNGCSVPAPLSGHTLVYRSSSGASDTPVFSFTFASIPAKGVIVVGGSGFTGTSVGSLSSGLAEKGGAIGIRDGSGALLDSVGWGDATNAFVEGSVAPAPGDVSPAKSLSRKSDGVDTDNNSADFAVGTPTPNAPNAP